MISKRAINLKQKLAAGEMSPGLWINLPSPTACEVIAGAGLGWVMVDAEHAPFNPETLQSMLMAFTGSPTVPVIRVPWNDAVMIKQVLDMGWDGVLTPQTNTAEEARQAVAACRYPPVGIRGFGPFRPSNYYRDIDEYVELANDSVICAIQIENIRGAEHIDEIARVPGIDWIMVGPADMSGSTEHFLDFDNPDLWGAIGKILDTAHAAGIPTSIPYGSAFGEPNSITHNLDFGCQLVTLGGDISFLRDTLDNALQVFREATSSRS